VFDERRRPVAAWSSEWPQSVPGQLETTRPARLEATADVREHVDQNFTRPALLWQSRRAGLL